ncbi:hypothetical protein [Nocardioides sp.]|uniref:hypothetical protein n=1 Tax=Nocardioides sp. TaxID=35761 RepID=UPI002BED0C31|nr:hypothetical protein [Nocardioides sp.]HXH78994.1 hypothetical protein [Nocardioides sp.]
MKKIVAIATVTSALIFGGLVAPAQAADPTTPPECDQAVQEWRDRATFWEGKFVITDHNLGLAMDTLRAEWAKSAALRANVTSLEASAVSLRTTVATLDATVADLRVDVAAAEQVAERRGDTLKRLRAKIRQLRRR